MYSSAAANQLLAYGGYGRPSGVSNDYDTSAYNYANLTAAGGALVTYGSGHMSAMDNMALYNRQCDYNNSPLYNAECINQSTCSKPKRRVTSSSPANHGADTCCYKKQRLVGAGYTYDATTTSSSASAAAAEVAGYTCSRAFDVINQA